LAAVLAAEAPTPPVERRISRPAPAPAAMLLYSRLITTLADAQAVACATVTRSRRMPGVTG
jgi:hypothetical protein